MLAKSWAHIWVKLLIALQWARRARCCRRHVLRQHNWTKPNTYPRLGAPSAFSKNIIILFVAHSGSFVSRDNAARNVFLLSLLFFSSSFSLHFYCRGFSYACRYFCLSCRERFADWRAQPVTNEPHVYAIIAIFLHFIASCSTRPIPSVAKMDFFSSFAFCLYSIQHMCDYIVYSMHIRVEWFFAPLLSDGLLISVGKKRFLFPEMTPFTAFLNAIQRTYYLKK